MSFADDLAAQPSAEEAKYVPRTEFDGVKGYIQTGPLTEAPSDFTALLTQFGYDPEHVQIVGHPRISKWEQRSQIRDEFGHRTGEYETIWLSSFRFHIAPVGVGADLSGLEEIVQRARVVRRQSNGSFWFVFQASDTQLGKVSRDGSLEQIVERYVQSVDAAKVELEQLRRLGIAGVQISMPGDCIEGNVSQGGKNMGYLTHLTVPEQVTVLTRLILYTIEQFAPLVEQVLVTVVNGNHDQAQRQLNTYPGDGWATQAATAVDIAMQQNPLSFGHVSMLVPDKWSGSLTTNVGDSVVCVVHGHQFRQWHRALNWLSEQAVHNQPAGAADVLQHGHFHTWRVESHKTKTLVCSSTFDCGSDHYRESHGAEARRGSLVYLLRGGEVSRMSLV